MMVLAAPTRTPFTLIRDDMTTSTEYERESLGDVINLSDGHARQPLTATQQAIVDRATLGEGSPAQPPEMTVYEIATEV